MNHEPTPSSTLGSLLTELREETTTLLRQEIALAKAEINEKASLVGKNTLELATGGALAYAGLIVLLIGVALLVSRVLVALGVGPGLAVWLGPVVVGVIVALIGASMAMKAKRAMTAEGLFPRETVQSLKEDKRWMQDKLSSHS
jgi:xanthine/uracil permease